jgi:hypothetical protein
MKKIVLTFSLVLTCYALYAKKVKFAVDMDTFAISPNGIHVSGDFQTLAGYPGGDWTSDQTECVQEGTTTIYSVVVDIPAFAKYEYKFVNGDQFYEVEFVPLESRVGYSFNDNRWIWVDSLANDTTFVGAIIFAGNAPAGLKLVRFLVDLNNQSTIAALPHLAGNFQNWNPATTSLYSFGDSVFEIINYLAVGSYQYKFINGNAWGQDESIPSACNVGGNRGIVVSKDTVLSAFCFGSCTICNPASISKAFLSQNFSLYPNPATDFAIVQFNSSTSVKYLVLTDIGGRVLRSYKGSNSLTIETQSLESGIYFLNVVEKNRVSGSKKLIVQ